MSTPSLAQMQTSLDRWDLLEHPFYQAWSAGTLPVSALKTYAAEYGVFIRSIADGWERLGEHEGAAIERQHVELWNRFAAALGTTITDTASVPQVAVLLAEAKALFATKAGAIGALYAFEVQQPATAQSKLAGLDTHYAQLGQDVRPYFEAHAGESGEDVLLEQKLAVLTEAEKLEAVAACERMSKALYDALSGIHAEPCEMN